jgi:hypothetical protein
MALHRESSRWLVGLLVLVVIDAAISAGTWLLCLHAWHWSRGDLIAISVGVAVFLGALGVAPVSAWATRATEGAARRGVDIFGSRAKGNIRVRSQDFTRIHRSKAGLDIDVTQDASRPTGSADRPEGKHAG